MPDSIRRAHADNLARRLQDAGHANMGKRVEIHLPANASPADINKRHNDIRDELIKSLIWDNYA